MAAAVVVNTRSEEKCDFGDLDYWPRKRSHQPTTYIWSIATEHIHIQLYMGDNAPARQAALLQCAARLRSGVIIQFQPNMDVISLCRE